ncbi:MAG TPA: hypothetical protein VKY36_04050 [Moheibacter sp.]|nr:hypothetical protein [Moheibacter sp.]
MQLRKINFIFYLTISFLIINCSGDDAPPIFEDDDEPTEVSPVVFDINAVPYPQLSDYNFFKSPIAEMEPVYGVLPFQPASQLFTDYALKKRFIWMPENQSASIGEDDEILNMPVGTILIKSFYYNNVLPDNSTKIIETRLMIHKPEGWIFANYVWNEEQTEAMLSSDLITVPISWMHNGESKNIQYQIPSDGQCFMCHYQGNQNYPIGPKPQNLNFPVNFADGSFNQLEKLKDFGYINNEIPSDINSIVDYTDTSESLDMRARSYMEINCAHCHKDQGYAEFYPVRLNFTPIADYAAMGFCLEPNINSHPSIPPGVDHIIFPGNHAKSVLHFRMTSTDDNFKMPMIGRTIVHEEGVDLINNWIDSFEEGCE